MQVKQNGVRHCRGGIRWRRAIVFSLKINNRYTRTKQTRTQENIGRIRWLPETPVETDISDANSGRRATTKAEGRQSVRNRKRFDRVLRLTARFTRESVICTTVIILHSICNSRGNVMGNVVAADVFKDTCRYPLREKVRKRNSSFMNFNYRFFFFFYSRLWTFKRRKTANRKRFFGLWFRIFKERKFLTYLIHARTRPNLVGHAKNIKALSPRPPKPVRITRYNIRCFLCNYYYCYLFRGSTWHCSRQTAIGIDKTIDKINDLNFGVKHINVYLQISRNIGLIVVSRPLRFYIFSILYAFASLKWNIKNNIYFGARAKILKGIELKFSRGWRLTSN